MRLVLDGHMYVIVAHNINNQLRFELTIFDRILFILSKTVN